MRWMQAVDARSLVVVTGRDSAVVKDRVAVSGSTATTSILRRSGRHYLDFKASGPF